MEADTGVGGGTRPMFPTIDDVMITRCTLGTLRAEESKPDVFFTVGWKTCVMGLNVGNGTGEPA